MDRRLPRSFAVAAAAVLTLAVGPVSVSGQAPAARSDSLVPRMPDGRPDLQGTYDLNTLTPVQRPEGTPPSISLEEAAQLEAQRSAFLEITAQPLDADRAAPPEGGDGSTGPGGNVGGYNTFWLDLGREYMIVDGEARTSLIVDPPDGRVPPMNAEGIARRAGLPDIAPPGQPPVDDPGLGNPNAYENPEQRPLSERCLLGFASTSGPPALPNYFYNNLHQIVQTPDTVMILTEMVHDARIIRMDAEHLPDNMRYWMGDSVGRWEGDTLVVDTTNFNGKVRFRGSGEDLRVVERFTRLDADRLLYQFTVEDPGTWDTRWGGEYVWPRTDSLIYEYACHESNYAMEGILRGARYRESEQLPE